MLCTASLRNQIIWLVIYMGIIPVRDKARLNLVVIELFSCYLLLFVAYDIMVNCGVGMF